MTLKKNIQEDLKKSLIEKKEIKLSTLRMLLSAISNKETEKRTKIWKEKPELSVEDLEKESELNDEEVIEVISSEIKKRKEAIFLVRRSLGEGGGEKKIENFINKEQQEMEVLQKYLPEQMSEEEIKKIVQDAIEKVGAKEIKDMGKVMAELMPKVKGKADGSLVSKIVKELIS